MPAPPRRPIGPRIEHAVPIPVGPPSIRAHRVRGLLINLSLSVVVTVAFVAGAEGLARWLEKPAPVVPLADTHGLDWREEGEGGFFFHKKGGGGGGPPPGIQHPGLGGHPPPPPQTPPAAPAD